MKNIIPVSSPVITKSDIKSINNVILRSDVVDLNQKNGVATCHVDVLEDPLRTFKDIEAYNVAKNTTS